MKGRGSKYRYRHAARDRRILAAAKAGVSYVDLAARFHLSRCMISLICTRNGYRRKPSNLGDRPMMPDNKIDDPLARLKSEVLKLQAEYDKLWRYHINGRANVEYTDTGLRICRGYHDKDEACVWEEFSRTDDLSELKRRSDN